LGPGGLGLAHGLGDLAHHLVHEALVVALGHHPDDGLGPRGPGVPLLRRVSHPLTVAVARGDGQLMVDRICCPAMANEPDDLVLEHLRAIRGVVDETLNDVPDLKRRLASMEKQVAGLRVDFAAMREDLVGIEHKIDRSDARLDRIEKRLGLVDAQT
jgi:hypothetical protein